MARGKGTANLAASLEVLAGAPLDARDVCPTVADLYVAANWPYKYIGMKTTVQATGDTYRLVNLDVTQESSWVLDGGGGSGSGGHTIEGDGTAVTDRDTLNFKDMSVSDDSQNEKTDVKPHRLTQSELADIISPLPFFDFSNPGAEAFIFSTNERIIGQWIDGKPLYQKTMDAILSVDTDGQQKTTTIDISSLNIDSVVNQIVRLSAPSSVGKFDRFATDVWGSDQSYIFEAFKQNTNAYAITTNRKTFDGETVYVTIQYTKTTDQPVATGEKIIGQWIDGKALYEKVITNIQFGGTKSQWVTIQPAITITNLDKLIDAKPLRLSDKAVIYEMSFKYTNNGLQYYCPVDFTDEDTLILRYTKS